MLNSSISHNIYEVANQTIMLNEYALIVEGPDDYKLFSRVTTKYGGSNRRFRIFVPSYFTDQNGCVGVRKVYEQYSTYGNRLTSDSKIRFVVDRDYNDFKTSRDFDSIPMVQLDKNSIESYSITTDFIKYVYETKTRCGCNQIDDSVFEWIFNKVVLNFSKIYPVVIDAIRGELDSSYSPVIRYGDSEFKATNDGIVSECQLRLNDNINALKNIAPHFDFEEFSHIRHTKGKWLAIVFCDGVVKTNTDLIQKCKSERFVDTCNCNSELCFIKMEKNIVNDILSKMYEFESFELWSELEIA